MSNKQKTAGKTAIQVYIWNDSDIYLRVECIDGNPWFVAKDLCDYLELTDVSKSLERLDDDEKLIRKTFVSGQERSMWFVNESGTYALILRSNKPNARKFRKWITSEVLPSIRKTGRYELNVADGVNEPCRHVVRRRRGVLVDAELANLLWLIGESLWHGDLTKVALELGVSRQMVYNVLNGYTRSSRVLRALYQQARERRESSELYNQPGVMADRLLGVTRELPAGNSLPTVHVAGKRGGKLGNQNARKHWRKEGE